MRNLYYGAAVFMFSFFSSVSAYAITVTGNASAIIRRNITATETQPMNFGTISSGAAAATVTLSPAGTRTSTLSSYGTSKAGVFTVTGEPSTPLTISFGKVPGEKRIFTDAETKMSKQAAIYAKVIDEKGKPVENTAIQVSGLQNPVRTDETGGALISDVEPYQKTVLSLDVESIEDVALVPEFEEKKLVLRPGTVYPLTIKCTHRGGIEGYLSGRPDLSSYKVVLTDKKGNSTTKIPETDGSFIFDNMAYGKYVLQVISHEGAVVCNKNINLQESYYVLAEAINL